MKKIISCLITLIMLFQTIPAPRSFAASAKSYDAAVVFDNMATNSSPTDELGVSGEGVFYVSDTWEQNNKAMKLVLKSAANTAVFASSDMSGKVTYSFMACADKEVDITLSLLSDSGKEYAIFYSDETGKINLYSGMRLGTALSRDKFRKFTVLADTYTKRISVYADGRACVTDWYYEELPAVLAGLSITLSNNQDVKAVAYLDNFVSCIGHKPKLEAPRKPYNNTVLEKLPEPEDEIEIPSDNESTDAAPAQSGSSSSVGNKVFANSDFESEDSMVGFQLGAATGGKNELVYDEKRGNNYVYVKSGSTTSRIDVVFDGTRYMVFEADLSIAEEGFTGRLFTFNNGEYGNMLRLTATGQVQAYSGGRTVCTLKKDIWTTVSCVCDFEKMVFDVYVDKKLIHKNLSMNASLGGNINRLRALYLDAGSGAVNFDNLKAYEGTSLRDLSNETAERVEKSIMPDGSEATKLLKNNTAFDMRSGALYYNGQKHISDNAPYKKDDVIYASPQAASALFGREVSYSSNTLYIDAETSDVHVAVDLKDGVYCISLLDLSSKVFGKNIYLDDRGFGIIASGDENYTDDELWTIHDYMLYDRPEPEYILDEFMKNNAGVHPRVIINKQDIENIKYNYRTKPYYKEWLDGIIDEADKILTYNYYYFDEETNGFSSGARRGVRDRVIYLSLAYFITGDLKYPQRAYNELVSAANFKHWRHQIEYLDTAEMLIAFAIGYDWLYDVWTDNQRKFIADTIMEKGLGYSRDIYYGVGSGVSTWWPRDPSNWNACCNHSTTAAAVALMDEYPELCSDLISKSLRGVETMLRMFYPSGAWFEGTGYYDYTMEHTSMWISTLLKNFGTDFNLLKAPTMDISADFMIAIDGPVASNNYHDASEGHRIPASLPFLGAVYNKPGYTGERLNAIQFYGVSPHFFDILYWPTEFDVESKSELPKDMTFAGTELGVMRSEYQNPESTYISYHAGDTVSGHSHVDSGTFVIDMSGVRWAIDLGADDYDLPGYFDHYGKATQYYRIRAEGHNVPVIDPDSGAGMDLYAFCPLGEMQSGSSSAFNIADLTPAYKKYCSSYRRGYMLAENRRTVTIRDEYEFNEGAHELYWFMHTRAEIEIADDKTAILSQNGKRLKAQLLTNIDGASFSVMKAEPLPTSPNPEQASNGSAVKLTVHAENVSGSAYIHVRFSDMDDDLSKLEPADIPLAQWTVDNTPYTPKPVLSNISADGVTLEGFDGKITTYQVPVPYKTRVIPTLSAAADDDCAVEIIENGSLEKDAVIKVYRKQNPTDSRYYYIRFRLQTSSDDSYYTPVSIKASSNPQPENTDVNAADGDLSTRWSASDDGAWLQYEFDEVLPIKLLRVAVMNATERKTKFDIEVSDDGATWTKIIEHETDGITDGYEYIECDASAKYVRLVGHGNSISAWTSILEFDIVDTRAW